jgi:hypothetical protein
MMRPLPGHKVILISSSRATIAVSQGDGLSATRPPDADGTMRDNSKGAQPKGDRKERLAAELRANLQKRKAQARARRAGEADSRPEGIAPAGKPSR